jgi:predicted component of type VI protein secretion system
MSPKYVKRVTLFKVPKEEDIDAIIAEYATMRASAQKVIHHYNEHPMSREIARRVLFGTLEKKSDQEIVK